MIDRLNRLSMLESEVGVGIVGIGSIGKGMALQAQLTPGIRCAAIADIDLKRAIEWAETLGQDFQVVENQGDMEGAISNRKLAVSQDGELIAGAGPIDVFMEATNSVEAGGKHAMAAIDQGKHVVMMNYEADLMFGPYLMKLADDQGVIYTVCDGDQPTVLRHLIDEIHFMGFELVMAGNMKGYLDRYVDPTLIIPEADKRNLDYRMCTSYTDGTKLCVEMAVLANGLGMKTSIPGMHGPRMGSIYEVFDHFDFDSLWADRVPVVDYVLGAKPSGGVFVIGYTDHKYQQDTLAWFPPNMGPGPYYLFYRPYHLGHFESMATVASAVLEGEAILRPDFGFRTNVYAYAKRDLKAGDSLDGIGGYASYGLIENVADNASQPGVPSCLADDLCVKTDIPKDSKILLGEVDLDEREFGFDLFAKATQYSPPQPLAA